LSVSNRPRPGAHTYLPMTVVDVRLAPNTIFEQEIPASYNGFLYPLQGTLVVDGPTPQHLSVGEIGWLEFGGAATTVRMVGGSEGTRVLLYAGERQDCPSSRTVRLLAKPVRTWCVCRRIMPRAACRGSANYTPSSCRRRLEDDAIVIGPARGLGVAL
jgi:hypothetical protein